MMRVHIEGLEPRCFLDGVVQNWGSLYGQKITSGTLETTGAFDQYHFAMANPGFVDVACTIQHDFDPKACQLIDSKTNRVVMQGSYFTTVDNRAQNILPVGNYEIRVTRTEPIPPWITDAGKATYTLTVDVDYAGDNQPVARDCGPLVGVHVYKDFVGTLQGARTDYADWYLFTNSGSSPLSATISGAQVGFNQLLYADQAGGLTSAPSGTISPSGQSASWQPPAGRIYIVVSGEGNYALTVRGGPAGVLSVSPAALGFGNVTIRQHKSLSFSIGNSGPINSVITGSFAMPSGSPFHVESIPFNLQGGTRTTLSVTFEPPAGKKFTDPSGTAKTYHSLLTISTSDHQTRSIVLSGVAVAAVPVAFTSKVTKVLEDTRQLLVKDSFASSSGDISDLFADWAPLFAIREKLTLPGLSRYYNAEYHNTFSKEPPPFVYSLPNPADGYTRSMWGQSFGGFTFSNNRAFFDDSYGPDGEPGDELPKAPHQSGEYTTRQQYEYLEGTTAQQEKSNSITTEPWVALGTPILITKGIAVDHIANGSRYWKFYQTVRGTTYRFVYARTTP